MTSPPLTPPRWIANQADFLKTLEKLQHETILAIDTESNSLYAYHERVCLVQFSTTEADYLVDPLAVDIHPLGALFTNPAIEKVFHAAEYDIICLRREYDFTFSNLFDTMLASRLLKKPALGLGNILQDEFGIEVNKRYQRANWGERPLKPDMLDYARKDTHYLVSLRDKRKQELQKADLWDLALEDFARLVEPNGGAIEKPTCWSVAGREHLDKPQMATLQALVEYRERFAEQVDLPLFKVLGDRSLVDLAKERPANWQTLSAGGWLSEKQLNKHGRAILAIVQAGGDHPVPRRKRGERPSMTFLDRYERLKRWRARVAVGLNLESDVVLPKDIIRNIAALDSISEGTLQAAMNSTPWRYRRFAGEILKLLHTGP